MNTIHPDILGGIHPNNVAEIWRRGDYSAFYECTSGSAFLDIALRFWDNHGELVASVGIAVHKIVDGEYQDNIVSTVLHRDGSITSIDIFGRVVPGYMGLDTLYLLLNPGCLPDWIPVDKSTVIENQESVVSDMSRQAFAKSIGITQLPPLEETRRFSQLREYMDELPRRYTASSRPQKT